MGPLSWNEPLPGPEFARERPGYCHVMLWRDLLEQVHVDQV